MTTRARRLLGILLLVLGACAAEKADGGTVGWLGALGALSVSAGILVTLWPKDDPIIWTPFKVGCILAIVAALLVAKGGILWQFEGWGLGLGALFLIWYKRSP